MSSNKKVSVIIPNYNYANFVGQAIESVLNQSYKNIEVIVINNGSTDNSLEILKRYKKEIRIVDQSNLGQSGARNAGLAHATGRYIAFLDADDYWESNKLEMQSLLLSKGTALVYCGINRFNNDNKTLVSTEYPRFRGNCSSFFIDHPGVSIVLSGESTVLFSRELLEQVGNFDIHLNSAGGWDFFRRCSKFTNFDFVSQPLTNYRVHSTNMSNSSENSIADIRCAYKKLFEDENWNVSPAETKRIIRTLEFTFLKTYVKKRAFRQAIQTVFNMNGASNY